MNRKYAPLALLLLLIIAVAVVYVIIRRRHVPTPVSGRLTVHFLNVGQGDSELLDLPDGGHILIDSGDRGAPTVSLLKELGVRSIDLAIATHPHADHIGEMRDVLRTFPVKEFWDSGFPNSTRTYGDMLEEIRDRGIRFETPRRGQSRKFGDVLVEVLHPGDSPVGDDANNASIVVRVTFGEKRFLFGADAQLPSWEEMLNDPSRLQADLLKVSHHGSHNGTSRELLDAVRPSIAVISCATPNDYGHPHDKTMKLFASRERSIQLFRTDLEGTITATSDGNSIEVTPERRVARDRLYLTGDELAGKVASGIDSEPVRKRGGRKSR